MTHPFVIAKDIADTIKADPVAASQVQEYISRRELIEALGLELTNEELFEIIEERLLSRNMDRKMRVQLMRKLGEELDV